MNKYLNAPMHEFNLISGRFNGLPVLRFVEAAGFSLLFGYILWNTPFILPVRLIAMALYILPTLFLCVYGAQGDDIISYLFSVVKRRQSGGVYLLHPPLEGVKTVEEKTKSKEEGFFWKLAEKLED